MTNQLLIYETAVPVSSARHGKASVEASSRFGFSRQVNSVPLMAVEFPEAVNEYPIVFAASGDEVVPLVVLGVRAQENLFLNEADEWRASYIPAFVRRYPFVFSTSDDAQTFTLCVDESFTGLNFQGRGQALFTADGKPSAYTEAVLKFLQEYRNQFLRTQAFCKKLQLLALLEPMQAQFTMGSGEKMSLTGFLVIDRKKLKALTDDVLADLVRNDELELMVLHMQSMRNFNRLKDKLIEAQLAGRDAEVAKVAEAPEEAATPADMVVDAPSTVQ